MVYLHFPSNLTEEELMLQAKYLKLKKKKKALQALKAPKPEPEKPILPKRPTEARDAREIARKLLKSGAIQAIKTPPPLPQNATFKRPRAGRERKLSGAASVIGAGGGVASYQPFSASQEAPVPEERSTPRVKNLYDSFVVAREKEEKATVEQQPKPKTGNTVFVSANRLTEEMLKKIMTPFGNIVNITMEIEKNKGFVTFERGESAAAAIGQLDGSGCEGGPLRVSLARRQPPAPRGAEPAWSSLAAHHSQKGANKDAKRSLVVYDDIFEP